MSSLNPVNMSRFWWMDHVSLCQSLKWKKPWWAAITSRKCLRHPFRLDSLKTMIQHWINRNPGNQGLHGRTNLWNPFVRIRFKCVKISTRSYFMKACKTTNVQFRPLAIGCNNFHIRLQLQCTVRFHVFFLIAFVLSSGFKTVLKIAY